MKEISSNSSAAVFRSYSVIIIILICIASFFSFTDHLSEKAENIARDQVVSDINYALAMMLYDYTIKGQLEDLKGFDRGNPFVPLAIYRSLPTNYHGAAFDVPLNSDPGWYFDQKSRRVLFISMEGDLHFFELIYHGNIEQGMARLLFQEN